ncbi:MAG TPA: SDR family NAD(P)-dependent oxidoreductase, partial [Rhizomicrobium sp.]
MYKPFDLSGKVALVTGGNRGIGFGMAEALAQAGADLVIWGTNDEKNHEAEAALKKHGGRVALGRVNVSNEPEVVEGMQAAVAAMGRIDCVIANAGIGGGAPSFSEMTLEVWRRVHAVNEEGVFFTLREACKHMVARAKAGDPGGSLVGVASLAGLEGAARNEAYSATKGAVLAMMRSVAVEHARYGIRANTIAPGWIATDMT